MFHFLLVSPRLVCFSLLLASLEFSNIVGLGELSSSWRRRVWRWEGRGLKMESSSIDRWNILAIVFFCYWILESNFSFFLHNTHTHTWMPFLEAIFGPRDLMLILCNFSETICYLVDPHFSCLLVLFYPVTLMSFPGPYLVRTQGFLNNHTFCECCTCINFVLWEEKLLITFESGLCTFISLMSWNFEAASDYDANKRPHVVGYPVVAFLFP